MFISSLNPFNLFESPVQFPFRVDSLYHEGCASPAGPVVVIDPNAVLIAVGLYEFPGVSIEFVEMLIFEVLEVSLDDIP